MLYTGIPWEVPPQELGSGMTAWRRLRDLLAELNAADALDWSA